MMDAVTQALAVLPFNSLAALATSWPHLEVVSPTLDGWLSGCLAAELGRRMGADDAPAMPPEVPKLGRLELRPAVEQLAEIMLCLAQPEDGDGETEEHGIAYIAGFLHVACEELLNAAGAPMPQGARGSVH